MTENVDKEVVLKGTLQFNDYRTYYMTYSRKRIIAATIASMVLAIVFYSYKNIFSFFGTVIYALFLGVVTGVLVFIIDYYKSKRTFKSETLIQMEQEITVNQQGIQLKTERSDSLFLWSDIVKAIQYKGLFLFYVSNVRAVVIPARFFQSIDSLQDFKFLVNKYLKCESNIKLTISEEMEHHSKI